MELLALEEQVCDDAEDEQGDDFLYDLELHEREGASVADKSDSVGRYLAAVFQKCDNPGKCDNSD